MRRASEKKHWDEFWSGSSDLGQVYGTDNRIIENLRKHVDFTGRRILEVGAGTGRDSSFLSSEGADVYTLDYSEESLKIMSTSLQHPIKIVCGDAVQLPFASGSFDIVFHQGLLEHFREPGIVLDENIRILKKGGVLLVDVPQRFHYYTLLKHILIFFGKWFAGWETEFTVGELRHLLQSRGMTIIGTYGHNLFPPIWYRGMRKVLLKFGLRLAMYPGESGVLNRARKFLRSMVPERVYINTAMVIGCIAKKP